MKAIKQSIWYMMTHSVVSIVLVVTIMLFFMGLQVFILADQKSTLKSMLGAITISLTMAVFVGVYFGGALQKLKQNYLWNINKKYRHSLIYAFLISILVFNLIQVPILYQNFKYLPLILLMPFCISVFFSYFVLGKNLLQKLLIPAIPLLISQSYKIPLGFNSIFILIILATIILVGLMFKNRYSANSGAAKTSSERSLETMSFATTGMNSKVMTSVNAFVGNIVASRITKTRSNISWAITMPHNKFAILTVFYLILIMLTVLSLTTLKKDLVFAFSILFLSTSLMGLLMESRLLLRQVRTVAHAFSGKNHRQLRNKILWALDKNFTINFAVFLFGIISLSSLFSIPLSVQQLLISSAIILGIVLAYYPLLLCFQWINISLALVVGVGVYAAMVFFTLKGFKSIIEDPNLIFYCLLFLSLAIIIRMITQNIFWRHPFESLLKNK